jgi:NAD(P)-dependent dehydrogenase (short-subunit alcohol dehydrogenase family)
VTPAGTSKLWDLTSRVVIVTGAAGGMGRQFVRTAADAGARVVVSSRRADAVSGLVSSCADAIGVVGDLTDDGVRQQIVEDALSRWGRIDVLVNNAGVPAADAPLTESVQSMAAVLDVNLIAPFALSQLVGRVMREQKRGSIVNVSSIRGLVGLPAVPSASYSASKGALLALTRELAAELGPAGVRVNALCPGWFPSGMTADLFSTERGRAWIAKRTLLNRVPVIEEIGGALLFLASDASSYITGQAMCIDGGWTAQ